MENIPIPTYLTENGLELDINHLVNGMTDSAEICQWLASFGIADPLTAYHTFRRLALYPEAAPALQQALPHILAALAEAANPDGVLVYLERFVSGVEEPATLLAYLASNPRVIEILVILFAGSQFLTEILLRNPEYFERLMERKALAKTKDRDQFLSEAHQAIAPFATPQGQFNALRRFQRWELLRIGACDYLSLWDMSTATRQLSFLADGLVQASLEIAAWETQQDPAGFAVLGLGKLGGEELNYSSDIDLVFVAGTQPSTYQTLAQRLIYGLNQVTTEGFLYRVDMRLRPWGRMGPLVASLDGYLEYLRQHARLWEKQALLKARVIAGDEGVGNEFLRQAEPLIYDTTAETVRANVREMKERTENYLRQQGREWGEVKLGAGSIRDVEFVTQYLQLVYGGAHPELRQRRTLDALARLFAGRFVSVNEYRVLRDGYTFLRTVENHLQLMRHRQTSTLPTDPKELDYFAKRLGFQGTNAGKQFLNRYEQHCKAIRTIYHRYLGEDPVDSTSNTHSAPPAPEVRRHIQSMDPSYTEVFSQAEIERHAELAARLDDDNLVEVDAVPIGDNRWRVTIVSYDFFGELSIICGLLFVSGFNIHDGHVFTYEPSLQPALAPASQPRGRRYPYHRPRPKIGYKTPEQKIVDVFTVSSVHGEVPEDLWHRYKEDLTTLLKMLRAGRQREAQGELAKRFAAALQEMPGVPSTLYPIRVEIDNITSERYTILHIETEDTIGFLYEFTNALALNGIYIARVTFETIGDRIHDILYVTDAQGRKITDPQKQRELRAATVLVKHFTHLLPHSPNPEAALLHFRELVGQLFTRSNWLDELSSLESPKVLEALARLLGVSDFLWNDFLRMQYASLFPLVRDTEELAHPKSRAQLETELAQALTKAGSFAEQIDVLNRFKDREMFRIDMRHILGYVSEFGQFSEELTELAEVVVNQAYQLCDAELRTQYGEPRREDSSVCPLSICALGKLGGRELGFASDIELMFVYAGNGETAGPQVITTAEYFEKLVQAFVQAIRAKREGIFEIDLRLRPYGNAGSMAVSLEAFRRYFAPDGPAWNYERQALVKLRPIAGDPALGEQLVALRDAYVYTGEPFDVAAMRAMRERQLRHLVTAGTINAKYSAGGLVDVEYLVQALQITHGHRYPSLRKTNIQEAMAALTEVGILSREDYQHLSAAHKFLRQLIDALRMVRGNAKDLTVPPVDSEEFAFLARRLGYEEDVDKLQHDLLHHTTLVQEINQRLLS